MLERESIDEMFRERLASEKNLNQLELARQLGRRQPWVSKLLAGHGKATIDDWFGVACYLGVEHAFKQAVADFLQRHVDIEAMMPGELVRDEEEKRVLRLWRRIPAIPKTRRVAMNFLAMYGRSVRPEPLRESPPQTRRRPPAKANRARGKREPSR